MKIARTRRQIGSNVLSTLVAALTTLAIALSTSAALAGAVIDYVEGDVEVGEGEPAVWRDAHVGDQIAEGGRVRTGADGHVEIVTDAGRFRVQSNSLLRIPSPEEAADIVELEEGRSLFDILRRAGRRFEVHTPTVVVSVKGTRFAVGTDADLGEVAVYRGMVGVRESGAQEALETLVREGFLASGGAGLPIEIEVGPTGDPWSTWLDSSNALRRDGDQNGGLDSSRVRSRISELDRAKASLHRATDADVLRTAADRKPEIAERLGQMQRRANAANDRRDEDPSTEPGQKPGSPAQEGLKPSLPAAMMPGAGLGSDAKNAPDGADALRRADMRQARQARLERLSGRAAEEDIMLDEMIDIESMTGGDPFTGGQSNLAFQNLQGMDPAKIMIFVGALDDLQTIFEGQSTTWTAAEFLSQLEIALVNNGMSSAGATALVNSLINN